MIELREDGSVPGPDEYGRIYKVVDPMTGAVGHNMWASDLPLGEDWLIKRIEGYDSFKGWVGSVEPLAKIEERMIALGKAAPEFEETAHTLLVKRARRRVAEGIAGEMDGFTAAQDMAELIKDLEGRGQRPALPGWTAPVARPAARLSRP